MATKKKTEIVLDDKTKALLEAAATGNVEAVDVSLLQDLLGKMGMKAVATGVQEARYHRTDKRREWMVPRTMTEDEVSLFKSLPEKLGQAPIISPDEPRDITQAEIDLWMDETLAAREADDMLKGRNEAKRISLFTVARFRSRKECLTCSGKGKVNRKECDECEGLGFIEDPFATGTFSSPSHGHKFTITKTERNPEPDLSKIEDLVDPDVWSAITDEVVVREVNEDKLVAAIGDGRIPMSILAEITPDKTVFNSLRVDALKEGDAL